MLELHLHCVCLHTLPCMQGSRASKEGNKGNPKAVAGAKPGLKNKQTGVVQKDWQRREIRYDTKEHS